MSKRVLVAMSGGVDSALSAALLLEQGFAVEGVTMKLTAGLCCDIGSAQGVAHRLGIPHRLVDAQEEFSREIVTDFVSEYQRGRTPNPCIRCNEVIKFQFLLSYAREHGFDFLATGHYARIEQDATSRQFLLKKGIDSNKDQSYFLYRLTQEQMTHLLFPLGGMHKTEVRQRAKALGLPAAERPESQEICFVPDNDYRGFLKEHAPETLEAGEMVLTDGTVVGKHDGIAFFTVGQRRGLNYAAGERRYVIRIEPGTRRVVLGTHEELLTKSFIVSRPHFHAADALSAAKKITVKIRYRSPFLNAVIEPMNNYHVRIVLDESFPGICPGQAAVFYENDTVSGGGMIEVEA